MSMKHMSKKGHVFHERNLSYKRFAREAAIMQLVLLLKLKFYLTF